MGKERLHTLGEIDERLTVDSGFMMTDSVVLIGNKLEICSVIESTEFNTWTNKNRREKSVTSPKLVLPLSALVKRDLRPLSLLSYLR